MAIVLAMILIAYTVYKLYKLAKKDDPIICVFQSAAENLQHKTILDNSVVPCIRGKCEFCDKHHQSQKIHYRDI